jgi:spore coat protein U-like protein
MRQRSRRSERGDRQLLRLGKRNRQLLRAWLKGTPARLALGAGCLLAAAAPQAGVYTGATLGAQTTITANCTISTTAVNFGPYDPVVANRTSKLDASGTVTIRCVRGTAPAIALGPGTNASGSTRRMKGPGPADFLVYELYQPQTASAGAPCGATGSVVWSTSGTGLFTATAASNFNARTYNVCGTVFAGQDPAIGTYNDTVTATVNF